MTRGFFSLVQTVVVVSVTMAADCGSGAGSLTRNGSDKGLGSGLVPRGPKSLILKSQAENRRFEGSKLAPALPSKKTTGKGGPILSHRFSRGRGPFGPPKVGDFRPDC